MLYDLRDCAMIPEVFFLCADSFNMIFGGVEWHKYFILGQELTMTSQEMEKGFQEIWKLFAETDKKFQETDKKFKETADEIKKTAKEIQETSKENKESERRLEKLFKETDIKIGKITGKWSQFVEGLVAPAAVKLFREWGIEVSRIFQRVKAEKNGDRMEIDILAVNTEFAILIEAKSTLGTDDVNEHIERLGKFKNLFPEYASHKVLGAVAGIVIDKGSDRYAYKCGFFVIAQSGETVKILNDISFKPRTW